jgi:hypothetical protein
MPGNMCRGSCDFLVGGEEEEHSTDALREEGQPGKAEDAGPTGLGSSRWGSCRTDREEESGHPQGVWAGGLGAGAHQVMLSHGPVLLNIATGL